MATLSDVPSELMVEILLCLEACDLVSFTSTCLSYLSICKEKYFWQQRLKVTPRRILQDEWFLSLAQMHCEVLLEPLVDSLDEQPIDEYALVLATVYLGEITPPSSLLSRLLLMVDTERLRIYLYYEYDCKYKPISKEQIVSRYLDELSKIDYTETDTELLLLSLPKNSPYDTLLRYERYSARGNGLILPSPEVCVQSFLDNSSIACDGEPHQWDMIKGFVLPYIMERNDLPSILEYWRLINDDSERIYNHIDRVEVESININPIETFNALLATYCHAETFNAVLNGRYPSPNNAPFCRGDRLPSFCVDSKMYKQVVIMTGYYIEAIVIGYTLEPDEFLLYVDSLPISHKDKSEALKESAVRAFREGYTYFADRVRLAIANSEIEETSVVS